MSRSLHSLNMGIIENRQQNNIENVHYDKYGVKNCTESLQTIKPTNPFKFLYYCCFVVLCALLVFQISKTVTRYMEKPTYTSSRLVRQFHAEFPALSICDRSRGFKEDILKVFNINIFEIICGDFNYTVD